MEILRREKKKGGKKEPNYHLRPWEAAGETTPRFFWMLHLVCCVQRCTVSHTSVSGWITHYEKKKKGRLEQTIPHGSSLKALVWVFRRAAKWWKKKEANVGDWKDVEQQLSVSKPRAKLNEKKNGLLTAREWRRTNQRSWAGVPLPAVVTLRLRSRIPQETLYLPLNASHFFVARLLVCMLTKKRENTTIATATKKNLKWRRREETNRLDKVSSSSRYACWLWLRVCYNCATTRGKGRGMA